MKEEKPEVFLAVKQEASSRDEPILIEEEELHVTLKKEESLEAERPSLVSLEEPNCRASHAALHLLHHREPSPQPDWRQIRGALHEKLVSEQLAEGPPVPKIPYQLHSWDQNKSAGPIALPEPVSTVKDSTESYGGGRVGKVLPMCKQPERQPEVEAYPETQDYGVIRKEGPTQTAAYCKAAQGIMSPLAKKKLLSQVCETNPYSFTSPPVPPPPPPPGHPSLPATVSAVDREKGERRCGEQEAAAAGQMQGCTIDSSCPEATPIFRPSVIQHAQSAKPTHPASGGPSERNLHREPSESYACRTSHHLQPPQVNPPWQPYLPRSQAQDGAENSGEKLVQVPPTAQAQSYGGDCYSSPHLHSLYRQTESCLSQERMAGYPNGAEKRGRYAGDGEGNEGFVCASLEREGLAYRSHYSDRTQMHGDCRAVEDNPRDFSMSKPLSQRTSSFSQPSFCGLPYPIMHQSLDSHPKACRVPPMTISPAKQSPPDPPQPFPSPKPSQDASLIGSARPGKRSLGELDGEGVPDRKVRVVTPMHPAAPARRSDPEELKPAEPAHAVHLNSHLPEGHPATSYHPPPHPAPLYPGMYRPGSLVSGPRPQDGLHQHPGLQYLKSQSAVSPLVPPLAFHSMMLHRQLLASGPSPHHFYRHPGGAALYGDLLHHLYPLSTLPPPQLSSVHPSTRL